MNFSFQLKPDEYKTDTLFAVIEADLSCDSEAALIDFIFKSLTAQNLVEEFKKYSNEISSSIHLFRIEIIDHEQSLTGEKLYSRFAELNFYNLIYKIIHFFIEVNQTSHNMDLYWEETVDSGFYPINQLLSDQYKNNLNLDLKIVADYYSSWTDFGHIGEGSSLVWKVEKLKSPKIPTADLAYLASYLVCIMEMDFLGGEELTELINDGITFKKNFIQYFLYHFKNSEIVHWESLDVEDNWEEGYEHFGVELSQDIIDEIKALHNPTPYSEYEVRCACHF